MFFSKIRSFIETHGPCKYLITDNGKEFKNKKLKKYCEQKGIKFIHWLPYRPHSQGVVERVHREIKKGLELLKEDMKKKFNIDFALSEVIINKNKRKSIFPDYAPKDLFFKNLTSEEIKKINNRMLDSQKFTNKHKNIFKINEGVLINENIRIEGNT